MATQGALIDTYGVAFAVNATAFTPTVTQSDISSRVCFQLTLEAPLPGTSFEDETPHAVYFSYLAVILQTLTHVSALVSLDQRLVCKKAICQHA